MDNRIIAITAFGRYFGITRAPFEFFYVKSGMGWSYFRLDKFFRYSNYRD